MDDQCYFIMESISHTSPPTHTHPKTQLMDSEGYNKKVEAEEKLKMLKNLMEER